MNKLVTFKNHAVTLCTHYVMPDPKKQTPCTLLLQSEFSAPYIPWTSQGRMPLPDVVFQT